MKLPEKDKKNGRLKFRKNTLKTANSSNVWVIILASISFIVSVIMLFFSQRVFETASIYIAVMAVIVIVVCGILFDMVGIAVASADETPFHSMASRKYRGSKRAIMLIRNADRVASICNDAVGDICGIISGAASALIVLRISSSLSLLNTALIGGIMSGLVASVTVGGKAYGKHFAIRNSNSIVYKVGVLIEMFSKKRDD